MIDANLTKPEHQIMAVRGQSYEEVLRPRAYTEGALKICRRYLEALMADMIGTDFNRRIPKITTVQKSRKPLWGRKTMLAIARAVAVVGPIAIGANAAPSQAALQAPPANARMYLGGCRAQGRSLYEVIADAYGISRQGPRLRGRARVRRQFRGGPERGVRGTAVDMTDFAAKVEMLTDRPVVDRTGLKRLFEINPIGWIPLGVDMGPSDPKRSPHSDVLAPCGLTIEYEKAPVEILVIDHVERPSRN